MRRHWFASTVRWQKGLEAQDLFDPSDYERLGTILGADPVHPKMRMDVVLPSRLNDRAAALNDFGDIMVRWSPLPSTGSSRRIGQNLIYPALPPAETSYGSSGVSVTRAMANG